MIRLVPLLLIFFVPLAVAAADIELTETVPLSMSHSINWVLKNARPSSDELGAWNISDEQWQQAVSEKGEAEKEEVRFDLWIPSEAEPVKGIVVISGHGSGEQMFKDPVLRDLARELHLALFKFVGNPMQRGFWPKSLLDEKLKDFSEKADHPELVNAPLFLYGHSNATGFSASYAAREPGRVWGWISMRPGNANQILQPGAAEVPGMIMYGEVDPYFAKDGDKDIQRAKIGLVEQMRKDYDALWHCVVEPKMGHGPTKNTWPLVYSFLKHSFAARVPKDADPRQGPVKLKSLSLSQGYSGTNWNPEQGGFQNLEYVPFAEVSVEKTPGSWLINEDYAADWQTFQKTGKLE